MCTSYLVHTHIYVYIYTHDFCHGVRSSLFWDSTPHKTQNEHRSHSTQTLLRNSAVSACHMVSWYTCKCSYIYANKKGTAFCVSVSVIVLIFNKLMLAWKISVRNSWTKFPTNGIVTDTRSQTDGQTQSSLKAIFLVLHKEHPIKVIHISKPEPAKKSIWKLYKWKDRKKVIYILLQIKTHLAARVAESEYWLGCRKHKWHFIADRGTLGLLSSGHQKLFLWCDVKLVF